MNINLSKSTSNIHRIESTNGKTSSTLKILFYRTLRVYAETLVCDRCSGERKAFTSGRVKKRPEAMQLMTKLNIVSTCPV